jgi:hypothetical protein
MSGKKDANTSATQPGISRAIAFRLLSFHAARRRILFRVPWIASTMRAVLALYRHDTETRSPDQGRLTR